MPSESSSHKTGQLNYDTAQDVTIEIQQVPFQPAPNPNPPPDQPVWRIRLDAVTSTNQAIGLDLNGEVVLGRDIGSDDPGHIDLSEFDAEELGVSRRHAMLRPTGSKLYILDLDSTNGTARNAYSIGVKTPHGLANGDMITLGKLSLVVRIIDRPSGHTTMLASKADLADALAQTAKAIISQLRLEEVLNQVAESAMGLVNAGEVGVWLIDPDTGDLFREAQRGIDDETIKLMRLPALGDSPAAQVIQTGKPVRAQREPDSEQLKIKTNYLAESILFVPIELAGETIGVISAIHREQGKSFEKRDENALMTIADFAAIAVQNSRTYQVTDEALARRVKELATINELSRIVTASLDLDTVYQVLIDQVHKHWHVEAVSLWLVDDKENLVYPYTIDASEDNPFEVGRGIVGKVVELGEAVIINEVQGNVNYDASVDTTSDARITATNMACVPLTTTGTVVGALVLFNKAKEPFIEDDLQQLKQFSQPVATAIQNARLFAESQRERATVLATASTLPQPLIILNEQGEIVIANDAASQLLQTHMAQVFEGLSQSVGSTTEIIVGDETYITTSQHQEGVGTIIMMQDITYVKQLEKTRTEFIHALSHDLKSPLASIKGWTYLLNTHGQLNEQADKFVSQIAAASDRMVEMVNQLLRSAMSQPTLAKDQDACDLNNLVETAIEDVRGAALHKNIHLEYKVMGDSAPVYGECQHLYRGVLNLLDNAIKYTPKDGKIWAVLTFWGDSATVQVRDNGAGIPEEDIPHVFEKGYRGVQTDGPEIGVGLGLSTVKSIVEAHNGTVKVENIKGMGAEFTITLPTG